MAEASSIFAVLDELIDQWCERRALKPLRILLPTYPPNGLTDGWQQLYDALRDVRALGRDDLGIDEQKKIGDAIVVLQSMIEDR